MLARRSTITLPNDATIDMPRLVPSFSSKGFPFFSLDGSRKGTKTKYSDTTLALESTSQLLTDSFLISAYDLHHRHFRGPSRFFRNTQLLMIDSGGYELATDYDSTEPSQGPYRPEPFTLEDYRKVLRGLPKKLPIIIANFDWAARGRPVDEQILAAQKFFNDFPYWGHNFIIKPTGTAKGEVRKYLKIEDILPHVAKLKAFHVVGVTEKELGKNLMDRLKCLARLRAEMNRARVEAPIHVWGGLDPVITPLYFFVGAEIFDGVSWLRYAYHRGMAVYRDCSGVLGKSIEESFDHVRGLALFENLTVLGRLTSDLRRFVDGRGNDFSVFEWHREAFERAYGVLSANIDELKGGA